MHSFTHVLHTFYTRFTHVLHTETAGAIFFTHAGGFTHVLHTPAWYTKARVIRV